MRLSQHPLWLAGFRPFFTLACLSGMSLPLVWALVFTGTVALPPSPLSPNQWHAHEMFYGFGWAVLGGFLLTATKNWVSIRGYHGTPLMLLAAAWLLERLGLWYAGHLPPALFLVASNLFLGAIVVMLLWTLVAHRKDDSYRIDNGFFLIALPLFIVAKNLLLGADTFAAGWNMTLALFRLAFLVMLERTLSQFMKGVFQATILRRAPLDNAIKLLALTLVFAGLLPSTLAGAIELTLASALLGRFFFWKPLLAMTRIDIGVMHLGYLGIVAQLLLDGFGRFADLHWIGTLPVHVFTFGVMGLIIPAMIIRIANGHTGRKVVFDRLDKLLLKIMIAALALRVVAPQLWPEAYAAWVHAAAACWFACFGLLGWRYIPRLMQPRVDGKVH
ncbi:MAG: NnrS family protein [Rhodocyclaceae bacterium]|nr:NnrS family protein [Rhodocyclaceae bacterium]